MVNTAAIANGQNGRFAVLPCSEFLPLNAFIISCVSCRAFLLLVL
jgi:hypothetical protein